MKRACYAFAGYRPHRLPYGNDESHPDCIKLKHRLMEVINRHLDMGIKTFITGMALGVDQWAAEIVLMEKEARPDDDIELWCAIPYDKQAATWSEEERVRYQAILSKANRTDYVSHQYYTGCLFVRNRYMVDCATHLIAVYDGQKGGTYHTINYAKKRGLTVTILNPNSEKNTVVRTRRP